MSVENPVVSRLERGRQAILTTAHHYFGTNLAPVLATEGWRDGTGRIARLELGGERMYNLVGLCMLLIFVQGIVDDQLEVRGR